MMKKTALLTAILLALSACVVPNQPTIRTTQKSTVATKTAATKSNTISPAQQQELNKQLLKLVTTNDINAVQRLIEQGANIHAKDKDMRTPLHHAAWSNENAEITKLLIDKGANIHAKDKDMRTPLHHAAWYNENAEITKLLIDKGADIHAKDEYMQTPLYFAAGYNENAEITKLLVDHGADVNVLVNGNKPFRTPLEMTYINKNPEVRKLLKSRGAKGRTPNELLFSVVEKDRYWYYIEDLLKNGANINAKNNKGLTPLDVAESNNHSQTVQKLTKLGGKHSEAYKQQKRKEELARQKADKERAKREEQEYARKRKCEHVYVGKAFEYEYEAGLIFRSTSTATYIVLGFSPKTGEVTARCERFCSLLGGHGSVKTFSCTQID